VKIEDCNSCLEEIFDSHIISFLCSNFHYDKWDEWENTYPGMIAKKN